MPGRELLTPREFGTVQAAARREFPFRLGRQFAAGPGSIRLDVAASDVYDRMARMSDRLDSFLDEIATVLELHLTMASNRLN